MYKTGNESIDNSRHRFESRLTDRGTNRVEYWAMYEAAKKLHDDNERFKDNLKEVWQILNVLSMCAMDDGEPYPKALSWLKEFEHLGYKQPNPD